MIDSAALRALAHRLEARTGGPSLDGYDLVDGLRAAANLLDGRPGPLVHGDVTKDSDEFPPKVSLRDYLENRR